MLGRHSERAIDVPDSALKPSSAYGKLHPSAHDLKSVVLDIEEEISPKNTTDISMKKLGVNVLPVDAFVTGENNEVKDKSSITENETKVCSDSKLDVIEAKTSNKGNNPTNSISLGKDIAQSTVEVSLPIIEVHSQYEASEDILDEEEKNIPTIIPRTSIDDSLEIEKHMDKPIAIVIEETMDSNLVANSTSDEITTKVEAQAIQYDNEPDDPITVSSEETDGNEIAIETIEPVSSEQVADESISSDQPSSNSTDVVQPEAIERERHIINNTFEVGVMMTDDEASRPSSEIGLEQINQGRFQNADQTSHIMTSRPRTDDEKQSARRTFGFDFNEMINTGIDTTSIDESPECDENKIRMDAATLNVNDEALEAVNRISFSDEHRTEIIDEEGYPISVSSESVLPEDVIQTNTSEFTLFRNKTDQVKDEEHSSVNATVQNDEETNMLRSENSDTEDDAAMRNSLVETADFNSTEGIGRFLTAGIKDDISSMKLSAKRVSSPNDRSNIFGMYVNHDFNADGSEREVVMDPITTGTKPKSTDNQNKNTPNSPDKKSPKSSESFVSAKNFFMAKSEVKLLTEVSKDLEEPKKTSSDRSVISSFDIKVNTPKDNSDSKTNRTERKVSLLNFELSKPVRSTSDLKLSRPSQEKSVSTQVFTLKNEPLQMQNEQRIISSHIASFNDESDLPEADSDKAYSVIQFPSTGISDNSPLADPQGVSDFTEENLNSNSSKQGFGVAFGFKGFKKRIGKEEVELYEDGEMNFEDRNTISSNEVRSDQRQINPIGISLASSAKNFEYSDPGIDENEYIDHKVDDLPESEASFTRYFDNPSSFSNSVENVVRSESIKKKNSRSDYVEGLSGTEEDIDEVKIISDSVINSHRGYTSSEEEFVLAERNGSLDVTKKVKSEASIPIPTHRSSMTKSSNLIVDASDFENTNSMQKAKTSDSSYDDNPGEYDDKSSGKSGDKRNIAFDGDSSLDDSSEMVMSLAANAAMANRRKNVRVGLSSYRNSNNEGDKFDQDVLSEREKEDQSEITSLVVDETSTFNPVTISGTSYSEEGTQYHDYITDKNKVVSMKQKNENMIIVKDLKVKNQVMDEVKISVDSQLNRLPERMTDYGSNIRNINDHVVCIQNIHMENSDSDSDKEKSVVTISNTRRTLTDSEELKRKAASLDDLSSIPISQDLERAVSLEFRSINDQDSSIHLHKHRINLPNSSATSIDEVDENSSFSQNPTYEKNLSGMKKSAIWGTLEDSIMLRHHTSNDSLSTTNGNSVSVQTNRRRDYRASSLEGLPSSVERSNSTKLMVHPPSVTVRSNPTLSMSNVEIVPTNLEVNFNAKEIDDLDDREGGPISSIEISGDHGVSITSLSHSIWGTNDEHLAPALPSTPMPLKNSAIRDISGATTIRVIENKLIRDPQVHVVDNNHTYDDDNSTNSVLLNSKNYVNDVDSEVTVTTVSGSGKTSFITGSPPSPPELVSPLSVQSKNDWVYTNGDSFSLAADHKIMGHRGSNTYSEGDIIKTGNSRVIANSDNIQDSGLLSHDQKMPKSMTQIRVDGSAPEYGKEDNRLSRTLVIPPPGTSAAISITQSDSPPPFLQPPY